MATLICHFAMENQKETVFCVEFVVFQKPFPPSFASYMIVSMHVDLLLSNMKVELLFVMNCF